MVLLITKTDFQRGGAADLLAYIRRDNGKKVPVRDHTGRELDARARERFIGVSERYDMERHFIVAPDPKAAYGAREVDRNVRSLMREWRADRKATEYVYAVHDSKETPHAHVAVTGHKEQLYMDTTDLESFESLAREVFKEPQRVAQRLEEQSAKRDLNAERKQTIERPRKEQTEKALQYDPTALRSEAEDEASKQEESRTAESARSATPERGAER
ncbi:hypothetical protein [Haloarchaeobius amylolyticus]|uniref:hypothetical protein n=1 Tax=Haloarchaeobius amylolyticus TaxID=1198296 RepID=UPI0022707EE0|nr:hypothetical protein [Haloarchaeobius amylolyticus]